MKRVTIDIITLNDFLKNENVPQLFDILSIDVEGKDWDIIRSLDTQRWKPHCIIIEANKQRCFIDYLHSIGYFLLYSCEQNDVYTNVIKDLHIVEHIHPKEFNKIFEII